MSVAIPPLPQYAFMAWCLVKAQGQLYLLLFSFKHILINLTSFTDIKFNENILQYFTPD